VGTANDRDETAMMIKTAGGPGLVSPIDYNERRSPPWSRATWVAIGIVVAGHVALGAAMYYQRFEMPVAAVEPEGPIIEIFNVRRKPPEPVIPSETPPAPNPRVNDTPLPTTPTDTIAAVPTDAAPTDSTILTFKTEVPNPVPDRPVTPTPAATPAPPVIGNPSWSRQPSAEQMTRAYPSRAIAGGVAGSASLNCLVLPNGSVTDCNVTRETPGGYGFGRAAEGLSRHFRVNPRTVNGAPEGSRVNINLRFNPPAD
jgi:protein TonB